MDVLHDGAIGKFIRVSLYDTSLIILKPVCLVANIPKSLWLHNIFTLFCAGDRRILELFVVPETAFQHEKAIRNEFVRISGGLLTMYKPLL